jgi:DNA replication protein DnaC
METKVALSFRRQTFDKSQFIHLKWKLMNYCESYFYESDGKIILSKEEKENLSKIFNWLIGYKINISLNKGLMFTGDYGTGKSVLMKAIIKFIDEYYSDRIVSNGVPEPMYILSHDISNAFIEQNVFLLNKMKTTSVLAIDDLGYETKKVISFGTEQHPFEEILMYRYDRKRTTLITTNLNLKQIGVTYGDHIKDRLLQMVYIFEFKGESKRK